MLILGLLEGGVEWAWGSALSIVILTASLILLALGFVERRAKEPIIPPWVFRHRVLNGTSAASLVVDVLLIGLTSYVPLYAQAILGRGALVAGLAVAALTMGWPIAAAIAGRFYMRIGFRDTGLMGSVFVLSDVAILLTVNAGRTAYHLALADRSAVLGRLAEPRSRHRHQPVRSLRRKRRRHRGLRCDRQRCRHQQARSKAEHLQEVSRAMLEPAIHDVYVCAAIVAVVMLLAIFIIPRRVTTVA